MTQTQDLSVQDAIATILSRFFVLDAERAPLDDLLGRVLAEPVIAQVSLPPFTNSSMDGYAMRAIDTTGASKENPLTLRVIGDIAAGAMPRIDAGPNTAVRIMTGAPVPDGYDAVVPVEDTDEAWRSEKRPLPETITIFRSVNSGDYLRYPGEDVEKDTQILGARHVIRPQEIGVLASLGVTHADVVRRPRVGILATGDELIGVDEPLSPGKIRNSNSYTQTAQVRALGAEPIWLGVARDDEESVRERLQAGLDKKVDLFISSAGVSVGAYDVVKTVLESEGNVGFWRVRMRPGKPLAFGTYQGVPYLGLPGNPVSAMVSFERFARPAILKMSGRTRLEKPQIPVVVQENIESDGRESYIRAIVDKAEDHYEAVTTGSQGSHVSTSLVKANALLIIPENKRQVKKGETLNAWMLNWPETVF